MSFHAEGVNSAMCDGAVKLIVEDIDVDVYARLLARNDDDMFR